MSTEYEIVKNMYADLAEYFKEERYNEVRKANLVLGRQAKKQMAQQRGYYITGNPPFGYRWQDGKLVPYQLELEVQRLAISLRNSGMLFREIVKIVKDKGYRNRNGNAYTEGNIHHIVHRVQKSHAISVKDNE
jgi:hypothetical protein